MRKPSIANAMPPGNDFIANRERNCFRFGVAGFAVSVFALFLFLWAGAPATGWAGENFFQIINDMTTPMNSAFTQDSGYAVYVSYEGKRFLMDTGIRKESLVQNMKAAGITLHDLDFVFLSHSHFDHVGGLDYVRRKRPSLPVYIPPGGGFTNPRGLIEVKDHLKVSKNIILVHTHNDARNAGISDELSLLLKTGRGPYLLTGCTHTGFFSILEEAKRVAGESIFFQTGGSQLNHASESTIQAYARKIKTLNVTRVSPSHCSAAARVQKPFKMVFGANYIGSRLGRKIPLRPPTR